MANIRLKTITVEPTSNLIIQSGDVSITNTTLSTSRLSGAFIVNGGIAINSTYNSSSSTAGGSLTVGGGLAVYNNAYFGNNLTLDNNAGTLSIQGISSNRLFLDNVTNKRFYISPDGINKRFDLNDTTLMINITSNSTNASTGAFVVYGGISINSTVNSTNSSNGGALTVGGGVAIGGDMFLSKSLTIGSTLLVRYTGSSQIALQNSSGNVATSINLQNQTLVISNDSDFVFNTTRGNFVFSNVSTGNTLLTITGSSSTFGKYININDTIESLNYSTGSIVVSGGISIQCSTDATSSTNGGALSIGGGLAVRKKVFTNDSIGVDLLNASKKNKLVLYQSSSSLTEGNIFTGFGISSGSLLYQVNDTSSDHVFYSSNTSGTSKETFRIKGTNEVQFVGSQQRYSFIGGGNTVNDLSIQGQSTAAPTSLNLFSKDGDSHDATDIKIFGRGLPNNTSNSEYLSIGWDTSIYKISSNQSGSGALTSLVLQTNNNNNQLKLSTDGTVYISSTTNSPNSSTGALVVQGGVSISGTTDSTSLTSGGALTLGGGMSVLKSMYLGGTLNINTAQLFTNNGLNMRNPIPRFVFSGDVLSSKYTSNLSLFSMNYTESGDYELISLSCNSTSANQQYTLQSKAGGAGVLHPIQMNVGNNSHIYLSTNGSIGLNTTNPNYQVDINGTLQANNYSYMNSLTIYNTQPATSVSTSGSLTVMGGASIASNLFVGGQTMFTDTTNSSSTSASVYMTGGLTIASGQSSNYGAGALTVLGGGYFGGEVYVQQNLNVFGNINGGGASSSTFAYMTITATDQSVNLSSGSFLTFGGITIQSYANAQNVSNGGSLLTPGGASIGKDVYIGGDLYNYGVQNFYKNTNHLVNFYDVNSTLKFSIDRDTVTNNFSISRFNTSGSFIEKSLDISSSSGIIFLNNSTPSTGFTNGSIVATGGITIQNTTNSSSLQNGGGLTVFGGASVSKNMFVGGDVTLLSTTNSTNTNQGALVVSGGVGISGNLNIAGNTVINGNLSVLGSTTTVYSTNTMISDNIFVVNSGPSGTADGGVLIQRYQTDNDTGNGDVVNDISGTYKTYILPNQTAMTNTQITLSSLASSVDNYYVGWWIKITSGFSVNQVRKIMAYVGSSKIATIDSSWTTQNPSIGDSVQIYDKPYVGLIWNETIDTFELGSTPSDPGRSSVVLTEYCSLLAGGASFTNTTLASSNSSGAVVVSGGLSVSSTADATSLSSGNALTIAGGASISKSLYVGSIISTNLSAGTVNISNMTSGNINFTGTLYQNGNPYISSQWFGSSGNLIYFGTSGSALVGIGTTNPAYNLDVVGTARISTSLTTGSIYATNTSITNAVFTNISGGTVNISSMTSGNINITGALYQNGSPYITSQWTGTNNILYFGTSGNVFVGIGTTNPGATLDVNGTLRATNFIITSTTGSLNSTSASFVLSSLSITNTSDVSSFTQGGGITVAGGLAVGKGIAIGSALGMSGITSDVAGTFSAANNVSSPADVTGLLFPTANIRSFTAYISIQLLAGSGNLYAHYTIEGIQNTNGWAITESFVGDTVGISFSINNSGQLQYTSTNITGWISNTFNYKSTSYSISGNYIQSAPQTSGNFLVTQNLTVQGTTDATSASYGSLVTAGGAGIAKSINVGGSVVINNVSSTNSGTFNAANGPITNGSITGLIFATNTYRSFSILLSATVSRTSGGNYNAQYTIEGIQLDSGWNIYITNLGDTIDLTFSINSSNGQIQYSTSTTYTNWTSTLFNYQATLLYKTGGFSTSLLPSGIQTVNGPLLIPDTTNSFNGGTGALVVSGGAGIAKNINVGGSVVINNVSSTNSGTFNATNGPVTNGSITGLLFGSSTYRSFSILLSATVSRTSGGNYNSQYTIEGIQLDSGWSIYVTAIGDTIDLVFTINQSTGQIQYSTSTTYTNWTSTLLNYQVTLLYKTGGFSTSLLPSGVQTVNGPLLIPNTTNSINTSTGALIVSGGVAIQNNINIAGTIGLSVSNIFSGTFAASNNVSTPTNITGLSFSNSYTRYFTCDLTVDVITLSALNSVYTLRGHQTTSGWNLYITNIGDTTNITFTITSSGQVQYTSSNITNYVSSKFNFTVTSINI